MRASKKAVMRSKEIQRKQQEQREISYEMEDLQAEVNRLRRLYVRMIERMGVPTGLAIS